MGDTPSFGDELRCLREQAGLSLRELSAKMFRSKTLLGDWENGKSMPDAKDAAQLDAILGGRGALPELRREDPHNGLVRESERLADQLEALYAGELVTTVDRATDQLAVDYLSNPGAALIDRVTAARRDSFEAMRARRLKTHHQIRYLTADVGYLSGILAYAALDDGHPGAALAHTRVAWRAAEGAGSDQLRAWIRGTQSLILRFMQRYPEALDRAQDGLRYATTGTARARLLAGAGQCYANMDEPKAVRLALAHAETALDGQRGEDELGGLFTFSRAKLYYYSGSSLIWLSGGADARQARDHAHTAIALWRNAGAERSVADEALAHIYAATGSLQVHDLEEAVADLDPLLSAPTGTEISWIAKRMDRIDGMLGEPPYDSDSQALELRERIKAFG